MITKFNTGEAVLIPATIASAEEVDGEITYEVDAKTWRVPENMIIKNEEAQKMDALRTFVNTLIER